jgi:catechol 2,3-dioxygenase-like lactoylglutathione lyase family enzyme
LPALVPELHVDDLERSLAFWRDACGFSIVFRRQEERFVFMERGRAQLMLCQRHARYETGAMDHPLGQGAMFQIYVADLEPLLAALEKIHWPLYEEPRQAWYRAGTRENGLHQFMVQDPDGYLIMFAHRLGARAKRAT